MKVDRQKVSKDWAGRGYSCDLWIDPPGQEWIDFVHKVDELVMLIEGEIEFEMEGKTLRPAVGEELFIPAGVMHSARNIGKTVNRWLYGYKPAFPI